MKCYGITFKMNKNNTECKDVDDGDDDSGANCNWFSQYKGLHRKQKYINIVGLMQTHVRNIFLLNIVVFVNILNWK